VIKGGGENQDEKNKDKEEEEKDEESLFEVWVHFSSFSLSFVFENQTNPPK